MIVILSIDSAPQKGVLSIKLSIKSKKDEVEKFLSNLRKIINSKEFDIDTDLIIIKTSKEVPEYSTAYALLKLEYNSEDVLQRIRELTVSEYSETLIDKDNVNSLLLFVFGKEISGRLVYMKLKIKEDDRKSILCLSFHYAKHAMDFPYK